MFAASCCLLGTLAITWLVLKPLAEPESVSLTSSTTPRILLEERRQRCLQALKDIELDFNTGKTSETEFGALKNNLSAELAEILRELDNLRPTA